MQEINGKTKDIDNFVCTTYFLLLISGRLNFYDWKSSRMRQLSLLLHACAYTCSNVSNWFNYSFRFYNRVSAIDLNIAHIVPIENRTVLLFKHDHETTLPPIQVVSAAIIYWYAQYLMRLRRVFCFAFYDRGRRRGSGPREGICIPSTAWTVK